jgi:hypothetical protein
VGARERKAYWDQKNLTQNKKEKMIVDVNAILLIEKRRRKRRVNQL